MLSIRLRRQGSLKRPFYRIVVSDSRLTPRARVVDTIGWYDPMRKPKAAEIDMAKADQWTGRGARPSDTVGELIDRQRRKAALPA